MVIPDVRSGSNNMVTVIRRMLGRYKYDYIFSFTSGNTVNLFPVILNLQYGMTMSDRRRNRHPIIGYCPDKIRVHPSRQWTHFRLLHE